MDAANARKRPASRGTAAYPRKRAVTACQTCRARRTKCDNLKPKCSFCLKTGAECIQSPVDLSSFDPASLHIIRRLDELETNLHSAIRENSTGGSDPGINLGEASRPQSHQSLDRFLLLPTQPEQLYDLPNIQQPHTPLASLYKSSTSLSASPFAISHNSSIDVELDGPTCKRLLDNFFSYVHVKNPILQEDATRRVVHNVSMSGLDWSPHSCLTLLICALGAIATPFGPSQSVAPGTTAYATGETYFGIARKRLGSCLVDGGLLGAQCLFLSGVYLMCVFQPHDAWRLFSQSLACCQGFQFDTAPSSPDASPVHMHQSPEEAAKQAIYWSAWKSEQEARGCFNMRDFPATSRVGLENLYPFFFPTPPVSSPDSSDLDEFQARERSGWYFYLTEISLKRLYRRVANEALNQRAETGRSIYDALAESLPGKEAEIQNWLQALPSPMSLETDPRDDDVCKFVLRGHLKDVYEVVYWPFVAKYLFGDCSQTTRNPSITALEDDSHLKQLAASGLSLHAERIRVNAPGFAHRHHGTWGMIRSCTRSALILLRAAIASHHTSLTLPFEWREAVQEVIQLNRYWQDEVIDARQHLSVLEQAIGLV